jgi:transcriptional regulator of acetoin/glycerol metabolism
MTELKTLDAMKKQAIIETLKKTKTANQAANALGISRATLYRCMKKYGIIRGALND